MARTVAIGISFANLKEPSYELTRQKICALLLQLYTDHAYILESGILKGADRLFFERMLQTEELEYVDATMALYKLSNFLFQYYGKKVIILLDEYDTPMQEAYVNNYWKELALTNLEVKLMFQNMIRKWFSDAETDYNDFVKALLLGDVKAMNVYMNRVALCTFSYFDTGKRPYGDETERFYHGFVLGLIVELQNRYFITSNRESGFLSRLANFVLVITAKQWKI